MENWIRNVTTVSTFPPPGIFTRPAEEVARVMATPEVSPLGIDSGIKMILFHINRMGVNLPAAQKAELKRAMQLMRRMTEPTWKNPPKTCDICGKPLGDIFCAVRKKSDKLLVFTHKECAPDGYNVLHSLRRL